MHEKERWFWSKIALAIGLLVFIGGFSFSVFKAVRTDREVRVQNDTGDITEAVIDEYGHEEGSIDLVAFLSDPTLDGISEIISDHPTKVSLTISDGSVYTRYHPSRTDFERGGISRSDSRFINVVMGGGSDLPGVLEVTVVEA